MAPIKGGVVDASGQNIASIRLVTDTDAATGIGSGLDPLRVDPTGTTVQPVSLSGGVTVASGTVAVTQATGTNLHCVVDSAPTTAVTGTFWQGTQPVSLASAPSTPVTGTFWQGTQPVSIASMPSTPVTGTFFQGTQPVSIASMPSTPVTGMFWQTSQPTTDPATVTLAAAVTNSVVQTQEQSTGPQLEVLRQILSTLEAIRLAVVSTACDGGRNLDMDFAVQ